MAVDHAHLQLPVGAATRSDIRRLQSEVEAIDNFLSQAAIRQPGTPVQLPKTSRVFDETVAANQLNMLQAPDRQLLAQFLQALHEKAPILHMSFNSDPSALFVQRLTTWLREHVHPYALLQIGLHPNIGAGCVVRTTNKYFDFSLRERFTSTRELLISQLHNKPVAQKPVPAAVQETPAS